MAQLFENKGSFYAHVPEGYTGTEPLNVAIFYPSQEVSYDYIGLLGRNDSYVYYQYAEEHPDTIVIINSNPQNNAESISNYLDELTASGMQLNPSFEFSHSRAFGNSLQATIDSYEQGNPVGVTVSMDSTASSGQLNPAKKYEIDGGGVLSEEDIIAFADTGSALVLFEEGGQGPRNNVRAFVDVLNAAGRQVPITLVTCDIGSTGSMESWMRLHAGINDDPIRNGVISALSGTQDNLTLSDPNDKEFQKILASTRANRVKGYTYEYWDYDKNDFVKYESPEAAWQAISAYWKEMGGIPTTASNLSYNNTGIMNIAAGDIIFDAAGAAGNLPPSDHLLVYRDELSAFISSPALASLEEDITDAYNLSGSLSTFVGNTVLVGDIWNLTYQKLGVYDNVLNERIQAAAKLGSTLKSAVSSLLECMGEYSKLDTSDLEQLKELSRQLEAQIESLREQLRSISSISDPDERAAKSAEIQREIDAISADKEEVDKEIAALERLKQTYERVVPEIMAAFEEVGTFSNTVAGITPSEMYTYVA